MKYFMACVLLVACGTASAADVPCSIHLKNNMPDTELQRLTKITMAQARATALASVRAPSATLAEGELEVERGCLIYSFDIRLPQHRNINEVWVDPGTGKVISRTQETPAQQAVEGAQDAAEQHKQQHKVRAVTKATNTLG